MTSVFWQFPKPISQSHSQSSNWMPVTTEGHIVHTEQFETMDDAKHSARAEPKGFPGLVRSTEQGKPGFSHVLWLSRPAD